MSYYISGGNFQKKLYQKIFKINIKIFQKKIISKFFKKNNIKIFQKK